MRDRAAFDPRPSQWSLRTRIVAALAFTVIVLSGTIAAIGLTSLRSSLVDQVDGELHRLSSRVMFAVEPGAGPGEAPQSAAGGGDLGQVFDGPGVTAGSVLILANSTGVSGFTLDADFAVQPLTVDQVTTILSDWPESSTREVSPGGGLGGYRFSLEQRGDSTVVVGVPLAPVEQTISSLGVTMAIVAIAGCLVFGSLAAWYVRHELRPLERVAATAETIARTPLERGAVDLQRAEAPSSGAATEVRRLVSGFNAMIDQVTQAFGARNASEEKVRRFVADASHELRTPLASIRGYSELTRRMSDDLPRDAVYALGRIESESVRMTSLVEDLLLLARIDEGQELERTPVELGRLVTDVVNDAAAAGPDHEWVGDVPAHPVEITGDPGRLQQVLVNLLANARVHTPAGTRVTVSLQELPDAVRIVVADTGPGIPAAFLPRLFERFTRDDSSRARTTGSTGLGLAIVQAIVTAHRGTVGVRSEPGDTRISVELPRSPGDPDAPGADAAPAKLDRVSSHE